MASRESAAAAVTLFHPGTVAAPPIPVDDTRSCAPRPGVRPTLYERLCGVYELPLDRQRSPAVEGLRGVAVALVFGVHYHALFSGYLAPASLTLAISQFAWNIGHSGVDVFFALSGALIYEVVMKRRQGYATFMKRRVQRIYPCFLAVFLIYLALLPIAPEGRVPHGTGAAALYLLANALLLPGTFDITPLITVSWSLSFEFLFYAVLPPLVYGLAFTSRSRRSRLLWICAASGVLIVASIIWPLPHKRMLMFTAGMFVLEARNSAWFRSQLTKRGEAGVALLFLLSFPAIVVSSASPTGPDIWTWSALAVLFVTYFWVILYVTGFEGWLRRICELAGLRWLGNISYSFYLLHGLTLKFIATGLHAVLPSTAHGTLLFWGLLPLAFPAAFLVSTAMFVAVEKPISLRHRPAPLARGGVV